MSNKTRKRFSPMLLVMSLAVVGVLAAFIAVAAWPGATEAHGPNDHADLPACADMTTTQQAIHDNVHEELGQDGCPDGNGNGNGNGATGATGASTIENSSTSASASVELRVVIGMLPIDAKAGSSVELYLEDDFQVPNSIDRDTVYFTVDAATNVARVNGGGRGLCGRPH